jgi:hypothetical protein
VLDEDIRAAFEKVVWVSVGQEPDLRELQSSIYYQLQTIEMDAGVKTDREVMTALTSAAKGSRVLLVLDDVWDSKHEKPLNCIDIDNKASRLLVTTRIRGLLKNASEVDVGVLNPAESLKLLILSAELAEEDVEEGTEEHRVASEIVDLCGRLPYVQRRKLETSLSWSYLRRLRFLNAACPHTMYIFTAPDFHICSRGLLHNV